MDLMVHLRNSPCSTSKSSEWTFPSPVRPLAISCTIAAGLSPPGLPPLTHDCPGSRSCGPPAAHSDFVYIATRRCSCLRATHHLSTAQGSEENRQIYNWMTVCSIEVIKTLTLLMPEFQEISNGHCNRICKV
ncbi:uncharacterized protein LOC119280139 [Triticum dicoccoides]|uniref:uncharacterized protein LOC119280139 n=1 Tax=Triticum dicoccoides TaxID=85692 RepID=UPI00188EB9BC|nr:uncharacterized protein LOC119280139 [Triticum dicoccoides]